MNYIRSSKNNKKAEIDKTTKRGDKKEVDKRRQDSSKESNRQKR
jgi:hypothetical protein